MRKTSIPNKLNHKLKGVCEENKKELEEKNDMGFTWIHLNQVNVGTNVAVGCASYQR